MTPARREQLALLALLTCSITAHWLIGRTLGFGYTTPIVLATSMPWVLARGHRLVWIVGLIAEVLTSLPPGIALGACVAAWALWRLSGRIQADVSVLFFLFSLVASALQVAVLAAPEVVAGTTNTFGAYSVVTLALSAVVFVVINGVLYVLPPLQQSVISLEGYKLGSS